ncbi:hypothetical protein [Haloglycomyces albus]|uniref:hypothetical protein n=1 Tax=Haloglycomyces albus TaxID=526067 RepID=UPI00046C926D|nr:hypothetical protein [Haloglycomyces albus]
MSDKQQKSKVPKGIRKLRRELDRAQHLHNLASNPYLQIVRLDRFATSTRILIWSGLLLAIGFTTSGVHGFIAGDRDSSDPIWWGAWAIEPALAGLVITILRWESFILSHNVTVNSRWVQTTKYALLSGSLVMNVVSALPKGIVLIVLHTLIPLMVLCIAEVLPVVEARLNTVRTRLLAELNTTTGNERDVLDDRASEESVDTVPSPAPAPASTSPAVSPIESPARTPPASVPAGPSVETESPASVRAPAPGPEAEAPKPVARPRIPEALLAQIADLARTTSRQVTADDIKTQFRLPASLADHAAAWANTQAAST